MVLLQSTIYCNYALIANFIQIFRNMANIKQLTAGFELTPSVKMLFDDVLSFDMEITASVNAVLHGSNNR